MSARTDRIRRTAATFAAAAGVWGCGAGPSAPPAMPEPEAGPEPGAPLVVDIVYPVDSQFVAARDSTFIFGNVSDPAADLFIGGQPVPVHPNGAFLGWVPVPREAGDTSALFIVTAVAEDVAATAVRWVRVPRLPPPLSPDSLAVDTSSISPRGIVWALPGEALRFQARATAGATAWVEWPGGERFTLAERSAIERAAGGGGGGARNGAELYVGSLPARSPLGRGRVEPARVPPPPRPGPTEDLVARGAADSLAAELMPGDVIPPPASARDTAARRSAAAPARPAAPDTLPRAVLVLARGRDTLRHPVPLDLWILDPARLPVVAIQDPPSLAGADGIVYGRPTANGTYLWFFQDGDRLPVAGRENGRLRAQLAPDLFAWIDLSEQVPLPEGTPPPRARVSTITLAPEADRVDAWISVSERVPYQVTQDGRRIELALYFSYAETDWVYYGAEDPFVRSARWRQQPGGVFVLTLDLRDEPWGYRVRYEDGRLVWTVRRPPAIDRGHPLRGRRIAVDPGHPPAGATGPTRLYEGDVNLAIALRLAEMLEERGAHVVLTRTSKTDSVPLYARPLIAESADAEILVSIHNNALPDGIGPFDRHGTMVFYFHSHSLDLARALQSNLLRAMGLRDLGIGRADLALARSAWMPSALAEGAFMMIPEQEALLRTERFQERYARGVLEGIEEFLRRRARRE